MRGVGGRGRGASPLGSPLSGSHDTRNAEIDPAPAYDHPGCNDPPNPPSSPSTASLSRVARCWHSNAYFSLFSSLFFFDPPNRFVRFRGTFHSFDPVGFCYFRYFAHDDGNRVTGRRWKTTCMPSPANALQ